MKTQDALCVALGVAFLLLAPLRLAGFIAWPWWLVTAPLWCLPALFLACLVLSALCALIAIAGMDVTQRTARYARWLRSRS